MSGASGVPDLLSLARLSRANHDLKRQLQDAQTEMISGEAADKVAATNGDPLRLLSLDNEIAAIDSRLPLISLAKARAEATETALGNAQEAVGDYAVRLLGFTTAKDALSARTVSRDAATILAQVMSAFNVQVSGRHVFGGDDAAHAPMGDAETLLAHVRDIYAETEPLEIWVDHDSDDATPPQQRADDATFAERMAHYFDLPFDDAEPPRFLDDAADPDPENESGADLWVKAPMSRRFSNAHAAQYAANAQPATLYTGGDEPAPAVELAADARLQYGVRGDDPAIASLVMNLARVAVAGERSDPTEMLAELQTAAEGLIDAHDGVTALRTRVGQDQSRIENSEARAQAERASFVLARNGLIGRDPYEAATRITQLETQLQSVYAMTVRLSNLSLLNFLR